MKYLLDTCVLSEIFRPRPEARVQGWLERCGDERLFISVITIGELQKGASKLAASPRKSKLQQWIDLDIRPQFSERTLQIDEHVALIWGDLSGEGLRKGNPLPVVDALIGATALAHGLIVVTRNTSQIARTGATLFDPWTELK